MGSQSEKCEHIVHQQIVCIVKSYDERYILLLNDMPYITCQIPDRCFTSVELEKISDKIA